MILRNCVLFLLLFVCGCNNINNKKHINAEEIQHVLDSLVQKNTGVHGIIFHVESLKDNHSYTGVAGVDEVNTNHQLKPKQIFRIASITKTYVAAAIIRLQELDKLSINDTIGKYISKKHLSLLKEDQYPTHQITIKQLLNHTSGIFDYAMCDVFFKRIEENPSFAWSRTDQLKLAMDFGEPTGTPGEKYSYSDTGYILLGEIIEKLSNKNLGEGIAKLLKFDDLNLTSTYVENTGNKCEDIVHPYNNGVDFFHVNPSIDLYGGGGMISTAHELALFYQALFEGKIFEKKESLNLMLSRPERLGVNSHQNYRMGIQSVTIDGVELFYHSGFWGSLAGYFPQYKCAIAMNFTGEYDSALVQEFVRILKESKE
jgi:D-alanyl-D-alanine carboxypeptidase